MNYSTVTQLPDSYPKEWNEIMTPNSTEVHIYKNLAFFKEHVKTLTQRDDAKCGISYKEALKELLMNKPTMENKEYQVIKNTVRNNLHKRGLLSEKVYESYKYAVEGDIVDVAKVIAEDPECCLVPNEKYTSFFYELFVSISYPYTVSNSEVMNSMAKLLATVQLLEEEHIYCKISLVFPDRGCNTGKGKPNYMAVLPIFSHRDVKSIETMSTVLNDRLLRKFFFAILEDRYREGLHSSYGNAVDLPQVITPVELKEEELCANILEQVIVKGTR